MLTQRSSRVPLDLTTPMDLAFLSGEKLLTKKVLDELSVQFPGVLGERKGLLWVTNFRLVFRSPISVRARLPRALQVLTSAAAR